MELNNEFEVDRPIDEAWALLTDVERIAPCLPGAQLEEIEGDEYRGTVKVKVGPITAQYKGKATFVEKDDVAHKAVLKAEGRDSRGQGNASALITAQLAEVGGKTKVSVNTDLTVTGKVAQFGRGVMADVSEKLLGQFVQNLETKVLSQTTVPAAAAATAAPAASVTDATTTTTTADATTEAAAPATNGASNGSSPTTATDAGPSAAATETPAAAPSGPRKIVSTGPVEPVDLLGATGAPLAKRLLPLLGVLLVLLVLLRLRKRNG